LTISFTAVAIVAIFALAVLGARRLSWYYGRRTNHSARHADQIGAAIAASPLPHSENIDLLRHRFQTLHIDVSEFARSDPLVLSELHQICKRCISRGACSLDLERASADAAWGEWRDYCPSAAKLNDLRIRTIMRSYPTSFE